VKYLPTTFSRPGREIGWLGAFVDLSWVRTITFELNNLCSRYLACWFVLSQSRSVSKVEIICQNSRPHAQNVPFSAVDARYEIAYRVAQKLAQFLYSLTLPNINRFSKLFHFQNQEKICNNTITKDTATPQLCCYTTWWNVKCLKSNNRKQDHFCNHTL